MRLLSLFALTACAYGQMMPAVFTSQGWNGFAHKEAITIHAAQVGGASISSYVATVSDTDANLKTIANSGQVYSTTGTDIAFSSRSDCGPLENWDALQTYTPTTGAITTSVQVGTVTNTSDTVFYRCYGDPTRTSFIGGTTGSAWPSVYRDVKHFAKAGALDLSDYTSNGNTGTASGNIAFNSSCPDSLNCASNSTGGSAKTSASGGFTGGSVEFWGYWTSVASCCQTTLDTVANGWQIYMSSGKLQCASDSNGTMVQSNTTLLANTWYHIVCTTNGNVTPAYIYINGVLDNTAAMSTFNVISWSAVYWAQASGGSPMTGRIAESRLINTYMNTAAQPLTDYHNQFAPTSFYAVGSQQ